MRRLPDRALLSLLLHFTTNWSLSKAVLIPAEDKSLFLKSSYNDGMEHI